uniref:MAD2L1-binding protein n=1 Tax=Cacopsylla melanoneura TaxID=428564 RepID=A0A8D8WXY6_9HEMI
MVVEIPTMSNNKNKVTLDISLGDSIITHKSCSLMVTELVKYIIHQKQLIPYPYEVLKYYVNKRKDLENNSECPELGQLRSNIASERYFKQTSDAIETIESFLESISHEIMTCSTQLSEVVLLLGSNPVSPHYVFQIVLPCLSVGHSDAYHSTRKPLDRLMKNILIDDMLHNVLSRLTNSTNMYVLLKLKSSNSYNNDDYILREHFHIPSKSQHVIFNFHTDIISTESCLCVIPFEDSLESSEEGCVECLDEKHESIDIGETVLNDIENGSSPLVEDLKTTHIPHHVEEKVFQNLKINNDSIDRTLDDDFVWYQNKSILKSFQEVRVRGTSVVNYWIHPETYLSGNQK